MKLRCQLAGDLVDAHGEGVRNLAGFVQRKTALAAHDAAEMVQPDSRAAGQLREAYARGKCRKTFWCRVHSKTSVPRGLSSWQCLPDKWCFIWGIDRAARMC